MVTEEGTTMCGGMGGSWVWAFLIFALLMGGGGMFGNRNNSQNDLSGLATKDDMANQFNFSALERQNNETISAIKENTNLTISAIKDSAYNNLSELRDLQSATNTGFSNMQNCCCSIERSIDGINYNGAINTASINANTVAQTQKILDALSQSKIDTLQNQVNQLQLQNAMSGVVKYPNSWAYNAGTSPFCNGGCGCNIYS